MCMSPSYVWIKRGPNWEQSPKPCGHCWLCKQNRLNDYVGRSLAEAAVSQHVATVNLTYAPRDDLADKVLVPRHFQLFMKLLRRAGHKVRYLVAGEYGSAKGRAHFHALLFFTEVAPLRGEVPAYKRPAPFCREIPSDRDRLIHISEWPHGHVTCEWSGGESAIRYVCKYLLADDKNNAWFSISKKPALGAAWFAQKAARARDYGVLPSSFEYLPPGGNRERPYLMTGATRRDYLAACAPKAADRPRMSEWVQRTYDKHERARRIEEAETAETLRLQTEGFKLPEPEKPEPPPESRTAEWYSDRRAEELAAEVDPNHKWEYPSCDWTPLVGAGYGTAARQGRPAFFDESRIYNPKPRPPARAVSGSGNLRRREGPPRSRGGRPGRGDEFAAPGTYPEYFQGEYLGGAGTAADEPPADAEAEGDAGS